MHKKVSWVLAFCAMAIVSLGGCDKGSVTKIFNTNSDTIRVGTGTGSSATTIDAASANPSQIFTSSVCGFTTAQARVTTSNPANAAVTIVALDPNTAIITNGVITAVSPGTARFEARVDGANVTKQFTVLVSTCGPPSVTLSPRSGSFTVGQQIQLLVTCTNISCTSTSSTIIFSSSNNTVISVNPNSSLVTCVAAGTARVTVTVTNGSTTVSDAVDYTCVAASTTFQLNQAGPITIRTGQNCPAALVTISTLNNILANWTSSNPSLLGFQGGSLNVSQVTLLGTAGQTGSSTVTATTSSGSSASVVVNLDNTTCVSGTAGTITVTPNPLNIILGNVGQLTATLNGITGTPTWMTTLGCVTLQTTTGLQVNVNTTHICRDSVVANIGTVKGFAIVNVTSGSTACTISGPSSVVVNQTANMSGSCGLANPYWFSRDPSRFTVLGAPFVCVYGGVGYACGPTATIKAIAAGTTQVCVQPAPNDHTSEACQTETATASSNALGNMVPMDSRGRELPMMTAPARGTKLDAIMTWDDYWKSKGK